MKWTIDEDCKLLALVRQHFTDLPKNTSFDSGSAFSKQLHTKFNSPTRDPAALLFRLKSAGILEVASRPTGNASQQRFRCLLADDLALYDYSVTMPKLIQALNPETVGAILHHFSVMEPHQPLPNMISKIATELLLAPMQVEKILIEHNKLMVTPHRKYERFQAEPRHSLSSLIAKQTPDAKLVDDINICRAHASQLYHVHERDGPEVIFSSDGTGFGKSYGVMQGYVEYIERFAKTQTKDYVFPEGGFTNLLFMSPQKSQIDLELNQKDRILVAGGEFICVLSRKDVSDLNFVDWASGLKNRERYRRWYEGGKSSTYIKTFMRSLNYLMIQIDRCEELIERLSAFGTLDAVHEREMAEEQLKNYRNSLRSTIESACQALLDANNSENPIRDYVGRGIRARQERLLKAKQSNDKDLLKMSAPEVYFELIKQVLPFEVCQFRPSVLLMTTNKFDTSTYRVTPRRRGDGFRFEPVGFDLLIGGKIKPKEPQISTVAAESHTTQVEYLRDEHFKLNPDCPFRHNDIRFTVVVDELHEAYTRLEDSCHVSLIRKENNLAHVLSVTGRIHNAVLSLERRGKSREELTTFEQEKIKFIAALRELLADKCQLSSGTTLISILEMFRDQLGAFEVNGDAAERIISITRNVFSFNAKMYVNEEGLKRIRMRNSEGDVTRTELYYEVEGDTTDKNPTLHDLFQLVSAILAGCAQITNRHFKRWVKNGGQDNASSQNTPLGQFVDAANTVAGEVRHIFDRTTDENLLIDHFYTYLQPKTVFTMTPVAELNYVNKGAERTVILAFEMDLVKELPEAMLLRLLIGTENKVLGLSATSGFSHTKNGSFSRSFLQRYADDLGYSIVVREPADISMLKELRTLRARIRSVNFEVFDAEKSVLTDTHSRCEIFRAVYDDVFNALREPLEFALRNPYKSRQHRRELEALLLAAYEGKNCLILSLSGGFKSAFSHAYRQHQAAWRKKYGMSSKCDAKHEGRHDQILTFTPFPGRHTVRLVFFDSPLANIEDIKQETYLQSDNSVLVFMSTYNSAGTGLNYFVKYHDGNINDEGVPHLDVDFQRLVLINSSFYSEVVGNGANLNTLPNYVSVLKHLADDIADHRMCNFSVNFAQGDNYRLLMAEHGMSLFKVIVQAVGRVERRDTLLNTEIFLPSDVMHNVAFQFSGLSEGTGNSVVLESMSLLNYLLKEFCEEFSQSHSFDNSEMRRTFEQTMLANGRRIDAVHKRVLKTDWMNRVRGGDYQYLDLCNLFRHRDSFTKPERWLEKLQAHPLYAANRQMQDIHESLFISRHQAGKPITLCHKRGPDGLAHPDYSALSDLVGGAREYSPELTIFPQYSKDVDFAPGNLVGDLMRECADLQKVAFSTMVPHPKLVPLLKGNLGEYLFDKVLARYGVQPLDDMQVFERLAPLVYEFFDRFIEVGDDLICVDVKRWATKLDDLTRAEESVEKGDSKIRQIRDIANQTADPGGQEKVRAALSGRYQRIKFVYINSAYSQNPNNLMWQENMDHTIHYLNLFQAEHQYFQPLDRERQRRQDKSRLSTTLQINPMLNTLLGC